MKLPYSHPETEIVPIQAESFICQSVMDEGNGTIDPVTPWDATDDVWTIFL